MSINSKGCYFFEYGKYLVMVLKLSNGKLMFKATEKNLIFMYPQLNIWYNDNNQILVSNVNDFSKRTKTGALIAISLGLNLNDIVYLEN